MSTEITAEPVAEPSTAGRRMLVVAAGAVASIAVWVPTGIIGGILPTVLLNGNEQVVRLYAIVVSSLVAGLAAWALLALLERKAKRPRRTWLLIATATLAVSLVSPLASAIDTETRVVLCAMHLIVGAVLIFGLGRSARRSGVAES
jgi:predicted permease